MGSLQSRMDPAELGGSDNDGEPAQQASGDDEASVAADTISLGDDAEGEEEAEDWWECHVADDPPPCGNDDTQPWPENEAGPSCNQPAAPNVSVYSSDLEVGSLDTSNVTMRKRKLDTLMVDGDGGFPHKKMLGVGDSSSSPASSDSESDSGDDSGGDEEEEGSVLMGLKRKNMAASVPLGKMKVQNSTIPSKSNPPAVMTDWLHTFQQWSNAERLLAIDRLIDSCEPTQVRHMMQVIEPQFQRDFISLLPSEVSKHPVIQAFNINQCV
ncbi:hypothetical protein B566_EDAN005957 [Ephemera danica]|nr:hypothetical protein B566_EDAN005957 [Ephemera danica]